MSEEQLREALKVIIYNIGESKISAMLDEGVNDESTAVADALHALLCTKNHSNGDCKYYDEGMRDKTWEREEHKKWFARYRDLRVKTGLSNKDLHAQIVIAAKIKRMIMETGLNKHILQMIAGDVL